MDTKATHAQEVFMVWRPPLIPPKALDIRSSNESESNISPNAPEYDGETEIQKQARERSKLKQGRRRRAQQRKEDWVKYESDIGKYNKKKLEQEAEERHATRMHNSPYNKIQEALEELEAVSHPNEEQARLREVLRSTAFRANDKRTRSRLPARSTSHRSHKRKPQQRK
jgi:hypothetical protein